MANTSLKNKLAQQANGNGNVPATVKPHVKAMLNDINVKKRFEEILGKKAPGFISSIITVTKGNLQLQQADPRTIISAAATAAALDLPIDPNLGFAYIIPYRNGKSGQNVAQFQLGYKGYIQMAMRTGQYKTINACEVYEGEIVSINRFTGEFEFGEKESNKIVGYIAYFKLLNGFEKYLYMTVEELNKHAQKFSKSYYKQNSIWKKDFHSMALKTVIKRLLSKFGILSIEMQTSLQADQAVITQDEQGNETYDYPDGMTIDADAEISTYSDEQDPPDDLDPAVELWKDATSMGYMPEQVLEMATEVKGEKVDSIDDWPADDLDKLMVILQERHEVQK